MAISQKRTRTAKPPRFLLLEDNWQHAETLKVWLEAEFLGADVRVMDTAKEFQHGLDAIAADPPDVIILDMMVRYTDADDADSITGSKDEDFFTAGARCYDLLASRNLAARAILYSVIDKDDLRKELAHLVKAHVQKREDKGDLLAKIKCLLKQV
jgi:DNA-binding NarL/FixJ family response regulator